MNRNEHRAYLFNAAESKQDMYHCIQFHIFMITFLEICAFKLSIERHAFRNDNTLTQRPGQRPTLIYSVLSTPCNIHYHSIVLRNQ